VCPSNNTRKKNYALKLLITHLKKQLMKKNHLIFWALLLCFNIGRSQSLSFNYAKSIQSQQGLFGTDMRIDTLNNFIYVTGTFLGVTDFDMSAASFTMSSASPTTASIYIAKYTTTGNFVWAKSIGNTFFNSPTSINFDGAGNVFIVGTFFGILDFDPSVASFTLSGPTGFDPDAFFAKYDSFGNFVYARAISGMGTQTADDIEIDNANVLYITGRYSDLTNFSPGLGNFTVTTSATFVSNIYVARYANNSGSLIDVKSITTTNAAVASPQDLLLDNNNNLYLTGIFNSTYDFDPGPGISNLTFNSGFTGFILKLDNLGNFSWVRQIQPSGFALVTPKKIKKLNQKLYVSGDFQGSSVDFDGGASSFTLASIGGQDVFTLCYDVNGNFIWANRFGGALANADVQDLDVTKNGLLLMTGDYDALVDFDPSATSFNQTPTGSNAAYINCLDSSGTFKFARSISSAGISGISSLSLDGNSVFCYGYFNDVCDFDITPNTFTLTSLVTPTNIDVYLARYEIDPVPSCTFATSQSSVCPGVCVSFTSGTTNTVVVNSRLWNFTGASTTTSSIQNPTNICYANAGTYTVSLTCSNGVGSAAVTRTLLVNALPNVSVTPSSTIICRGRTMTLTANGATSYSWNTNSTNAQISISPTVTTSYSVVGTNALTGCSRQTVATVSISLCTGIESMNEKLIYVRISPNPFTDRVSITSDVFVNKATLFNALGELVYSEMVLDKNANLNLESLSKGIYFMQLETEFGTDVKKIIKD
jgi:PKD repeat protein